MPEPYSLVRRAWLPVALKDGRRVFVRPCDIASPFDGQPIIRVDTGRPDCDISLTEFLIGLLAVAIGPKDRREWLTRYRETPSRKELEKAFERFEVAMILDGVGPRFFQDVEAFELNTKPKDLKRPDQLFVDGPGDNTIEENADHFVKREGITTLSRAGAAIALLTIQTMSPSGGPGKLTSVRGGGPLTTLVVPGTLSGIATLWQRLWSNVPYGFGRARSELSRVFPWLAATRQGAKGGIKTTPSDVDPAQVFFGLPRRIRLLFEQQPNGRRCDLLGLEDDWMVTSFADRPKGTDYKGWSRSHPLSPYYKQKVSDAEFLPLHLQSSRVGYREWLGMVMETQNGLRVPARCLDDFRGRAVEIEDLEPAAYKNSRLLVAGYAMDNMKPLDFAEALVPLIIAKDERANEAIKELAQRWVMAADLVANQLVSAVRRALFGRNGNATRDSTVLDGVRFRFWADTEDTFYAELRWGAESIEAKADKLPDHFGGLKQSAGLAWLSALKRHALRIFDDAVPIESAESDRIADIIEGRKFLVLALTGYGSNGKTLFEAVSQPTVET